MRAVPRVIEVGALAVLGLVEDADRGRAGVRGVGVGSVPRHRPGAPLPLVVELAEVVVEGPVLLHEDDDLVDGDGRSVRAAGHRLRGKSARIEGAFGNPLGWRGRGGDERAEEGEHQQGQSSHGRSLPTGACGGHHGKREPRRGRGRSAMGQDARPADGNR